MVFLRVSGVSRGGALHPLPSRLAAQQETHSRMAKLHYRRHLHGLVLLDEGHPGRSHLHADSRMVLGILHPQRPSRHLRPLLGFLLHSAGKGAGPGHFPLQTVLRHVPDAHLLACAHLQRHHWRRRRIPCSPRLPSHPAHRPADLPLLRPHRQAPLPPPRPQMAHRLTLPTQLLSLLPAIFILSFPRLPSAHDSVIFVRRCPRNRPFAHVFDKFVRKKDIPEAERYLFRGKVSFFVAYCRRKLYAL